MRTLAIATLLLAALTFGAAEPAMAYVGPGAGLSMLGALWGLVAAIVAALGFILLWPFRRLLKRKSGKRPAEAKTAADSRPS